MSLSASPWIGLTFVQTQHVHCLLLHPVLQLHFMIFKRFGSAAVLPGYFVCKNGKVASTFFISSPLCWLQLTRVSHPLLHVLASRPSYYDIRLLLRLVEEHLVSQMLLFIWSSAGSVADAENLKCHLIWLCIGIQVPSPDLMTSAFALFGFAKILAWSSKSLLLRISLSAADFPKPFTNDVVSHLRKHVQKGCYYILLSPVLTWQLTYPSTWVASW